MVDLRAIIRAALAVPGALTLTQLATAIIAPGGPWAVSMESARSALSRWLKGSRADGCRAAIPLHALEAVFDALGLAVVPRPRNL